MISYLVRRLIWIIPVILVVTLVVFSVSRILPGNPVYLILGNQQADQIAIDKLTAKMGLDKPIHVQYAMYIKDLLKGDFGDEKIINKIDSVSFIMMFDILLHQANPNWDDILTAYSKKTQFFLIYNQQWVGSDNTIRLHDLSNSDYLSMVPNDHTSSSFQQAIATPTDIHPVHKKQWKDTPDIWQWGITDNDLIQKMDELGFEQTYFRNHGQYGASKNFKNHAFIFKKR